MKLTKAQRRLLEKAKNEGSLIAAGIDQTEGYRHDVAVRLFEKGLIKWKAPDTIFQRCAWAITDAGRDALK